MPTFYTRQSSAEIVDGQVIEASDFNNEFDAIDTAFQAVSSYVDDVSSYVGSLTDSYFIGTQTGSGHKHTGTNGQGPLISLTGTDGVTGVTGVLASRYGGVTTAASDPTGSFSGDNYQVGAVWVNTSSDTVFICVDNTSNAAIWQKVKGNTSASLPTTGDDVDSGYRIGSLWIYTGGNVTYALVCLDASSGAAVWAPLARGRNEVTTTAPTASFDTDDGYEVGSLWVDTSTDTAYIAVDVTSNAAVWTAITGSAAWETVTSTGTFSYVGSISDGDRQLIDTSSGSFVVIGPNADADDVEFTIGDYAFNFATEPVYLVCTIAGVTGTYVMDIDGLTQTFVAKNGSFRMV